MALNLYVKKESVQVAFMKNQPKKAKDTIAYCHHMKHKGFLNEKLLKEHQCLQKNCSMLEKIDTNIYWCRRELVNCMQKYKKNDLKGAIYIDGVPYKTTNISKLVAKCEIYIAQRNHKPTITYFYEDIFETWQKEKEQAKKELEKKLGCSLEEFINKISWEELYLLNDYIKDNKPFDFYYNEGENLNKEEIE